MKRKKKSGQSEREIDMQIVPSFDSIKSKKRANQSPSCFVPHRVVSSIFFFFFFVAQAIFDCNPHSIDGLNSAVHVCALQRDKEIIYMSFNFKSENMFSAAATMLHNNHMWNDKWTSKRRQDINCHHFFSLLFFCSHLANMLSPKTYREQSRSTWHWRNRSKKGNAIL